MVATILYWGVVGVASLWALWTVVFSLIYLRNHENGNLRFFAIINAIGLVALGLFTWVMANPAWQKYWFVSTVLKPSPLLIGLIVAYAVIIGLQLVLGVERTAKTA